MDKIADRVKKIIVEHLGCRESKVTDDARLADDLGADSLDEIELLMAAEKEFGCDITDDDAEKVVTVRDAIALVRKTQTS